MKRQLVKWLSFRLPEMLSTKRRRAYYRRIWFSRRTLIKITQRCFTTPNQYHKRPGRWVLRLPGPIKEISFDIKRYQRPQKINYPQLTWSSSVLSVLLLTIGVSGIYHFSSKVQSQPAEVFISSSTLATITDESELSLGDTNTFYPRSTPTRIIADSISLDASITTVGKEDDGTLGTPPFTEDIAGWYKLGPSPGELGPAIINGHVGTYRGWSVFKDLHKLGPGDEISIKRKDNTTVQFVVTKVDQYDINNFPTDNVYSDIDHAGLRLITCGGTFDSSSKRYSHNTVVYAKMTTVDHADL
ncbi:MAG: class F sortase [Candidatus Saccharimonadales bacterium]|nr:class F sortase [Candidatus Saccharimonadales bacterium]